MRTEENGAEDIRNRLTVIEYSGRWMIQNMSDLLAGIPPTGVPIPVSGKSQHEDMLE